MRGGGESGGGLAAGGRADVLVAAAALVPIALFLVREQQIAGAAGFPLDDSWIHLHFARNLAEGAGFSYNPGVPVAGSTAPLWTLLVALAAAAVGISVTLVKVIGVAATMASGVVTRRAALAWGAPAPAALAAAIALVWGRPMAWGALSGMEVSLAALLVAAALLALGRDRVGWTAACAALAVLARPEALLLIPLLAVARGVDLRRLAIIGAVTIALLTPAVWFSMATVGAPLPATAAAKVEGGVLGWLIGVREPMVRTLVGRPLEFLWAWGAWLARTHWLLPVAIAAGLVLAGTGRGALRVAGLALVLHPLGMALLAPYRDPSFQEGRYSIHLLPLAAVLAALGLGALPAGRWRRGVVVVYLLAALAPLATAADRYAWAVQNINAMQVHLGQWIDTHVPPASRLAVNDIGAIAYFSRRPIIDLMGLVTPDILPYRRRGEEGIMTYIAERCPDYVVVFPAWFPLLTQRADALWPVYRVRLARNEVSGADEMVVYRLTRCP